MAKIKSLETLCITSKVVGFEDVSYELKLLTVKTKINLGMRLNAESKSKVSIETTEEIMTDFIVNSVVKIENLEFDNGTKIENGEDLVAAFEETSSHELLLLVLEMQSFINGDAKELEELKKK